MEKKKKKQIVASVLLASMMFAVPGYADYGRMPDENDSYNKYKSPLEQSFGPIVNDRPKTESVDDSEVFARVAGRLTQRAVSNIDAFGQKAGGKEVTAVHEAGVVPANESEKRKGSEQDAVAAEKLA